MAAPHSSPYAGSWYPGETAALRQLLEEVFAASAERRPHLLRGAAGFVVPHAGLRYSGTVAAAAWRGIGQQQPRRVILLGFSHRRDFPGISIPEIESYRTPLGEVRVDRDAVAELARSPLFRGAPEATLCDHAVEIQLPLLQWAAPGAAIVPLYVGRLSDAERGEAARVLSALASRESPLVASSDLTHYGADFGYLPFPPGKHTAERLRRLDEETVSAAGSIDPDLFLAYVRETGVTVCGAAPIALLLAALQDLSKNQHRPLPLVAAQSPVSGSNEFFQEELDYQTSGEITGDYHHSVSYASLAYLPADAFRLGEEDRATALAGARAALRTIATGERLDRPRDLSPGLARTAGVFVTLRCRGDLRGCIGSHADPIGEAAADLALKAALNDQRFRPLTPSEIPDVTAEISILSPFKRVAHAGHVVAGLHGAYVECGACRALLLPQVASSRNWGTDRFLAALAQKAGLESCETPGARLFVFRAQVFGEEDRSS